VLDQDIMTIPEAQIPKARNVMTIVGGEVVYQLK
jgi:predicted amidohydrolase YtcJ